MPCERRTLSAYRVCAHELRTARTCSATDRLFVIVTPRILTIGTRAIPGSSGGASNLACRRLSTKTISAYFDGLILRLFAVAQSSTCLQLSLSAVDVCRGNDDVRVISELVNGPRLIG